MLYKVGQQTHKSNELMVGSTYERIFGIWLSSIKRIFSIVYYLEVLVEVKEQERVRWKGRGKQGS